MPDVFTKAKRSEVMAAIRSQRNKQTELRVAVQIKVPCQPPHKLFWLFRLAFRDCENPPTKLPQCGADAKITVGVPFQFLLPPGSTGLRDSGIFAILMQMPEAAVDKDNRGMARHDDVGLPREVFPVEGKPQSHPVENAAHPFFRRGNGRGQAWFIDIVLA